MNLVAQRDNQRGIDLINALFFAWEKVTDVTTNRCVYLGSCFGLCYTQASLIDLTIESFALPVTVRFLNGKPRLWVPRFYRLR